jgi:hypothetical protein
VAHHHGRPWIKDIEDPVTEPVVECVGKSDGAVVPRGELVRVPVAAADALALALVEADPVGDTDARAERDPVTDMVEVTVAGGEGDAVAEADAAAVTLPLEHAE